LTNPQGGRYGNKKNLGKLLTRANVVTDGECDAETEYPVERKKGKSSDDKNVLARKSRATRVKKKIYLSKGGKSCVGDHTQANILRRRTQPSTHAPKGKSLRKRGGGPAPHERMGKETPRQCFQRGGIY